MMLRLAIVLLCTAAGLSAADTTEHQHVDAAVEVIETADPLAPTEAEGAVVLRVGNEDRQIWRGLGASTKAGWVKNDDLMTPERRDRLGELLYDQAGLTTLRVWVMLKHYAPDETTRELDAVMPPELVEHIRDARERGVRHLLLGPAGVPDWLRHRATYHWKGEERTRPELRADRYADHAALIAELLAAIRDQHGITFEATGIQNEPNTGNDCYFSPGSFVESVKLLRAELDRRELRSVAIVGPETASCDHVAYQMADALQADPEAWTALDALATHSYNMGVTDRLADVALAAGKDLWQTEASSPGPEKPGDLYRAAIAQTTILSDINHAVTHWIHFIGAAPDDPRDNGTRIIAYHPEAGPDEDWITVHRKHLAMTQIGAAFAPDAVIRRVADAESGESAVWTYGRKPHLTYAAGRNPDGSWALAVSNFTYGAHPDRSQFQRDNAGRPAQRFSVTIQLPADCDATAFALRRSGRDHVIADEGPIEVVDGAVSFTIDPLELVTLRSADLE